MKQQIDRIRLSFETNMHSVRELLNFDSTVLDFAILHLEELSKKLKALHKIDNPHLSVNKTISLLKGIRTNDSLKIYYKELFNQCLVLLVSHFTSIVRDLFNSSIDEAINSKRFAKVNQTQITLTLHDLHNDIEKTNSIGEILSTQKDISFQDMQSISRAFKEYLLIEIRKDENVNNIILAQACRHAIVHYGAIVDQKLINQVANATPRSIKKSLKLNSEILFIPTEVELIGKSMQHYMEGLFLKLEEAFNG